MVTDVRVCACRSDVIGFARTFFTNGCCAYLPLGASIQNICDARQRGYRDGCCGLGHVHGMMVLFCIRNLVSVFACAARRLQVSELTDTCEALTLDKEQLALEKEDLQVSCGPTRATSFD